MTVMRGGKADRVPLTIYGWLMPQTDAARKLQEEGLTVIGCTQVYSEDRDGVEIDRRDVTEQGVRKTLTRITTPVGEINEVMGYDPSYGSPCIEQHLLKSPDDFAVMRYMVEHTSYAPSYSDYAVHEQAIGEAGIVVSFIQPLPVVNLWVNAMGAELWCESLMNHTDAFNELHEAILVNYKRQIDIAAESPAEIIWLPDNVTASMISPTIFEIYCAPVYDYSCRALHEAGKLVFSHYDGLNRPLKSCIAATGIDIIEAFTPPPMGDMTVAEGRAAWPNKVLSLNFPGCLFREAAEVIEAETMKYMEEAGDRAGFAIGCTEDFDPALFEHAFGAISRAMRRAE